MENQIQLSRFVAVVNMNVDHSVRFEDRHCESIAHLLNLVGLGDSHHAHSYYSISSFRVEVSKA